jgi:hypothetical protein
MGYSMGNRPRFSGASAGDDDYWTMNCTHCLTLLFIEPGKKFLTHSLLAPALWKI